METFVFVKDRRSAGRHGGGSVMGDGARKSPGVGGISLASAVRGGRPGGAHHDGPGVPLVARYGGDEFEVLLPGADRRSVMTTAQRLVKLLSGQKFMVGAARLSLSIAVGGAVKRPAIYETRASTSISDVVQLAGGLANEAFGEGARLAR